MRKILGVVTICVLVCLFSGGCSGMDFEKTKLAAMEQLYEEVKGLFIPQLYFYDMQGTEHVVQDAEKMWFPAIVSYSTSASDETLQKQQEIGQDILPENSEKESEVLKADNTNGSELPEEVPQEAEQTVEVSIPVITEKQVVINRTKLQDFDYLRQNFYQVDKTTTIGREQLDVNKLLGKDVTLQGTAEQPQVLIYHTHSQEGYADSKAGDASMTVVGLGDYLEKLLEEGYGISVLHHKGEYDVPDRDSAYSRALPQLEQILNENPSIEVVIDLHRDGIPETTHLVTEINGKQTAQIMFFNGLSRTTARGELDYLPNPNLETNLAFSFQMQLAAAEYYPGFTRRIYLKGYRYNMHLCPKSLLIEVGAQNNTFAEAWNAMEPLADILARVLKGQVD